MQSGCSSWGILSPLLFKLVLRLLEDLLPDRVRVTIYADNVLLHVTTEYIQETQSLLFWAL